MKTIAVLCFDGVVPFDLSVPLDVFGLTKTKDGTNAYKVLVCGPKKQVCTEYFEIKVPHYLKVLSQADTIIVPGLSNVDLSVDTEILKALRNAADRGARIASICSGSFVLAQAGLLNGLKATTHWVASDLLQSRYPLVDVDPNALYIDNGNILTSAGAAAGLDLCLYLVRKDHGSKIAAQAARLSVVPLERSGGQSQFIVHEAPESEGSLEKVLGWMQRNFNDDITVSKIASKAKMSERTLIRRFKEQTGTSPKQWLLKLRISKAQEILESTSHSIELVADKVGFGCGVSFREHFRKQVGVSPNRYRMAFRSNTQAK